MVRRNLSSALILEDDVDWDVRLRDQLYDFALSAHALTQPLANSTSSNSAPQYADTTFPDPRAGLPSIPDLAFDSLPATLAPTASPYGDQWTVLWLGHCGMRFPFPPSYHNDNNERAVPKGRVVRAADPTVPQQQHLWTISDPDDLKAQYANHTRVTHHMQDGVCSLAYAVTRKGARQLLLELGLKPLAAPFDIELRWFCEGGGGDAPRGGGGAGRHTCLTTQPSLFGIHLPAGPRKSSSDITDHGDGFQEKAVTRNVRYSVRMNADALMEGRRTDELVDQWPDANEVP